MEATLEQAAMAPEAAARFVAAGKAIFTVSNPAGERYTFKVRRPEPTPDRPPTNGAFVALLTGSNNTSDYSYLGMVNLSTAEFRLTAKSRMGADAKPVRVAAWVLRKMLTGAALPPGYEIHHAGRCGRCGRLLTVPSSIETGLGPECAAIMGL